MKKFSEWSQTKEMKDWFEKRTKKHINLVRKYGQKIYEFDKEKYKNMPERLAVHDDSKFKDPEMDPYIYISWKYKCKKDGVPYEVPEGLDEKLHAATLHRVLNNSHHPEFHSPKKDNLINKENRDAPPKEMVDATSMSDELGGLPKEWADKNVNVRWKFNKHQVDLIYKLINVAWEQND